MKIRQVKKIPIEWDKPRVLQYPFPVMKMLKERTGIDFFSGQEWKPQSLEDVSLIVWAGLSVDDPELTEEEAFSMLDMGNVTEIMNVALEAMGGETEGPLPEKSGPDTGPSPDTT